MALSNKGRRKQINAILPPVLHTGGKKAIRAPMSSNRNNLYGSGRFPGKREKTLLLP